MRYMIMFKVDAGDEDRGPACKTMPEMESFIADLKRNGTLLASEGLHPSDKGARVRLNAGKFSVTDGPFAEAKELVAGFALVEAATKSAAIELAEQFLTVAGGGSAEVREVF